MKPIFHTCPICKKEFHGKATRIYCSMECRRKAPVTAWNKGKTGIKPNRPKNGEEKACQYCGDSFYVPKNKASAKYCSMACYLKDRWNATGICHNCGKNSEGKFCSPECQSDFWNKYGNGFRKKARYWERKVSLIRELGNKCARCGNNDIRVLDIHHIDQTMKLTPEKRSYNWTRRFKDWEANRGNLEVLCANCHRVHTWDQMGYGQTDLVASLLP